MIPKALFGEQIGPECMSFIHTGSIVVCSFSSLVTSYMYFTCIVRLNCRTDIYMVWFIWFHVIVFRGGIKKFYFLLFHRKVCKHCRTGTISPCAVSSRQIVVKQNEIEALDQELSPRNLLSVLFFIVLLILFCFCIIKIMLLLCSVYAFCTCYH